MNAKPIQKVLYLLTLKLRKLHLFKQLMLWLFSKQKRSMPDRKIFGFFLMFKYQIPRFCYFTFAKLLLFSLCCCLRKGASCHGNSNLHGNAPHSKTSQCQHGHRPRSTHPMGLLGIRVGDSVFVNISQY